MSEHTDTDNEKETPVTGSDEPRKGHALSVVIIAVAVLALLSIVPWGALTGNRLKDYNLLSDLMPTAADSIVGGEEYIDPELAKLMAADTASRTLDDRNPALNALAAAPLQTPVDDSAAPTDTIVAERPVPSALEARVDGLMVVEDYTPGGRGLARLRKALDNRSRQPVRIGVIGDSYIEGDIFTASIRDLMQQRYGGRGVGYMAAHSQVAGFRSTIRHSSSGWTQHPVKDASRSKYFTLAGEYYTGGAGATIKFDAVGNPANLSGWNTSTLLFIAPAKGSITLSTGDESVTYDVAASESVQAITLDGETKTLKVTNNVPGLILLGVWLEDGNGVVVDCMSVRGDSGINRKGISTDLASQLRQHVDYDLIVVEYGINALSSTQKDYSFYSKAMVDVLNRIKQCYPQADIILMGIGDRGQKIGGEAKSFATARYMVDAQREAARKAGVMFYDTRESMGGEGAVVQWRKDKLINGDYIHLNFNGGKALATTFVDAIIRNVNE